VVGRRKKVVAGRCRIEIEAALASPVFGQTRSIEIAMGVVGSAEKGNQGMATIGQHFLLRRQRFRWLPGKQALNLNVKSVKFPRGHHEMKPKTGRTSAHAVCWRRRVGAVWKEPACPARGNPCLSVKLDDSLFCASFGSMRAWPGRIARIWP